MAVGRCLRGLIKQARDCHSQKYISPIPEDDGGIARDGVGAKAVRARELLACALPEPMGQEKAPPAGRDL